MWANFSPPGGRDYLERQVCALGAPVEDGQLDPEPVPEVPRDVLHHVRFGGRGQAKHRRYRPVSRLLPDEAAHITVIRPEIVPPARQAVRLVQHPGANFPLIEHPAQRAGAKLLRGDKEDARIAPAGSGPARPRVRASTTAR